MATELLLIRDGNRLAAAEPISAEAIDAIGKNETVAAKITRSRNGKHHRKFFVLIGEVFKNQDRYPTMEHLLDAIKIGVGHYDTYQLTKTREVVRPRSISYAKMGQEGFEQFYNSVVNYIITKILPGTDKQDLESRVMEILGSYGYDA